MSEHKEWLNNEYALWCNALKEADINTFKSHPQVYRMLGSYPNVYKTKTNELIRRIDQVGGSIPGQAERYTYYARKLLSKKPKNIIEIGGGSGQFCATVRALGFKGEYFIYDLPEVLEFQKRYFKAIEKLVKCPISGHMEKGKVYCVSLYALGEFDDQTKNWYLEMVVKYCDHGMVVWNPHSGASAEINFPFKVRVKEEYPLTSEGNKLITW